MGAQQHGHDEIFAQEFSRCPASSAAYVFVSLIDRFRTILLLCRDLLDIAGETYPGEAANWKSDILMSAEIDTL